MPGSRDTIVKFPSCSHSIWERQKLNELIELVVIGVMSPADTGGGGKDGWSRENSTCERSEVGGLVARGHQETRSGGRGPASTYCEDLTALIEWDEKPMEGLGPKTRVSQLFPKGPDCKYFRLCDHWVSF